MNMCLLSLILFLSLNAQANVVQKIKLTKKEKIKVQRLLNKIEFKFIAKDLYKKEVKESFIKKFSHSHGWLVKFTDGEMNLTLLSSFGGGGETTNKYILTYKLSEPRAGNHIYAWLVNYNEAYSDGFEVNGKMAKDYFNYTIDIQEI